MEIPGTRLGTRRTQLRVPSVEDPYVLLAIQYMIIDVFTGCRHRRSYIVYILSICWPLYFGCPSQLYICNQPRVLQESQSTTSSGCLVGPSPYWVFSILGRARYTNNGYPKGIPILVAPECLGKSKTCVETPIMIIFEVKEIQGESIDPEIHQVNIVNYVQCRRSRKFAKLFFLSGARPALPMGVAPESMGKCLHLGIDSSCTTR